MLTVSGPFTRPATAGDISVDAAELEVARLINADRARHGLLPVRLDGRLMGIAGARSADMASRNYFSHTQPDGRDVFDMIAAARIRWYGAGEIIAWNTWPGMVDSATAANTGWMQSTGHRRIILSRDYNYMGVGLSIANNGRRYWTAVFLRGPDRTGGWVRHAAPYIRPATADTRRVFFAWTGGDVRLPVLTAGFHSFQAQRRIGDGPWVSIGSGSALRSYGVTVANGSRVELRVRSRDRAGNYGIWRAIVANT
jgi:hypothetical protein